MASSACHSLRDATPFAPWLCLPLKTCMSLRIRLMLRCAFLALPFQMRQYRRSTSATIVAFAVTRAGLSDDKFAAASLVCFKRIAMWNQSKIGSVVTWTLALLRSSSGVGHELCQTLL